MRKALLAIYAIWGFNWVVMKEANQFFSPVFFVACRFALGAAVLLGVNLWLRLPLPPRRYWKWIFMTGILQIAVNNAAMQTGMETLSAGLVAVLNYSMPIWVAVLAHFILGEHLTWRKVSGIAISMLGLFILMHIDTLGNLSAILLTLGGAVAWAAANIIVKLQSRVMVQEQPKDGEGCSIVQYTTWQMVTGAVVLFLYLGLTGIGQTDWNWMAVGCLAYNGILASAAAFFLWNFVLSHMEAGTASVAILVVPVVGVLCGVIFLQEALQLTTALGMLLILSGVVLIVRQK